MVERRVARERRHVPEHVAGEGVAVRAQPAGETRLQRSFAVHLHVRHHGPSESRHHNQRQVRA